MSGTVTPVGTLDVAVGVGVTDGDKGDIVVSGSGTVWTLDPVTNAKLDTMATQTFKGRTTAGTGQPEDLTAAQATALLAAVVGDSGSGGTKGLVPAPASGDAAAAKFLAASGLWAAPAIGLTPIATYTPSSGTITIPLSSTYTNFLLIGHRLEPTTAGELLQMQIATDGVPNFLTAASYHYDGQQNRAGTATIDWQSTTDTRFLLSAILNAAGTNMADLVMDITNGPVAYPEMDWKMKFRRQTTNEKSTVRGSGYYAGSSSRWTHLRLAFNSGDVSSNASVRLYAYL